MAIARAIPVLALATLLLAARTATAQQPANDAWADRTIVAALPFSASQPLAGNGSNDATDPDPPCRGPGSNPLQFSIWFGYTTGAHERLRAAAREMCYSVWVESRVVPPVRAGKRHHVEGIHPG